MGDLRMHMEIHTLAVDRSLREIAGLSLILWIVGYNGHDESTTLTIRWVASFIGSPLGW